MDSVAGVERAVGGREPFAGAGAQLDQLGPDRGNRARQSRDVAPPAAALATRLFGSREEALEIAEAIAPIAALVDAVEPESPLVAPRPDRVGMDAQEASRLGDREGRIGRTRRELRGRISRGLGPPCPAPPWSGIAEMEDR